MHKKNYIGYVNDHSGSMGGLENAAIRDYNANITATKDAASREMLDTVVSVVGVGYPRGRQVTRQVVISNPHVLKPVTQWDTNGGTPLWDGIGNMIELLEALPDANSPDVSFLIITTTDGQEEHSTVYNKVALAEKINKAQQTGRWTFVFRVPRGGKRYLEGLNVPLDNIQEWDTSSAGMAASTAQTTSAVDSFYAMRSAGGKSSSSFYTNAAKVDISALVDITSKVSLYLVDGPGVTEGMWIRDFLLTKRSNPLKGSGFYQLTKTEPKIGEKKLFLVRDRTNGKIYGGASARVMLGLPKFGNVRLHPGDHANYDIFVQSESVNRKLVKGTGLLYWEEVGVPFTTEELERFLAPTPFPAKPVVVQLPTVPVSTKPTKSPIPVTKQVPLGPTVDGKPAQLFKHRDAARAFNRSRGIKGGVLDLDVLVDKGVSMAGFKTTDRWAVFV
jgi:hypothetical protein